MIRYYFDGGAEPLKVALFLEEAGLAYESLRSPDAGVPTIVDDDVTVSDGNAILLHLGMKHGLFVPAPGAEAWPRLLGWLMFVSSGVGQKAVAEGSGPAMGGAIVRTGAARHQFPMIDARLAGRSYLLGGDLSIADMALWSWIGFLPRVVGQDGGGVFPHLTAWHARISERPATYRALIRTR